MKIEKTKNTPEVIIENDTIQLNGESYPENSTVFYHPIIEWINKKMDKKENINMIFNLSYFNTNSLKVISDLFFILDKYELKNEKKVKLDMATANRMQYIYIYIYIYIYANCCDAKYDSSYANNKRKLKKKIKKMKTLCCRHESQAERLQLFAAKFYHIV